jgi:hypothetical protein
MPIDPQDGFPDDWHVPPSAEGDGFPDDWHVPPSAEGDGFPDDWHVPPSAEGDGFPDDWHVPPSAEGDGFPNDWYVPASAAPGAAQGAPAPHPSAAAYMQPNAPATDSFAAFLPFMPLTRASMSAWGQQLTADGPGAPALPQVLPPAPSGFPDGGKLRTLASLLPNAPSFTGSSLFGGTSTPEFESSDAPPYSRLFGGTATHASSDASETGDAPRPASPVNDPYGAPLLGQQIGSAFTPSLVQRARLETGDGDQPASGFPLGSLGDADRSAFPSASGGADNSSGKSPSAVRTDESRADQSDEPGSITRLVRDSSGRPLAIIHLEPDQSGTSPSGILSDAPSDGLQPGNRYAQLKINNAGTGNPFIDRTTEFLLDALAQTARAIGPGSGPVFGIRVHTDFGRRVEELDLPGIGKKGVEQSFRFDFPNFVRYGLEGSIRTDVALSDPKNPARGPIVVYDLKTGNAVLTASRAAEIRNAFDKVLNGEQERLPIIVLRYRTLDAGFPRGSGASGAE